MLAILSFRKLNLPLHLQCNSNSSIPTRSATNREHQSIETARHHICIYHIILIGWDRNEICICFCNVILKFRPEKLNSSAIISARMVCNLEIRWPGDSQRKSGRFVRIDSYKNLYFHDVRAIRSNRLKPAIRNFLAPRTTIRKKRVRFGNPETICANQAIRANRFASGHLTHHAMSLPQWHL